MIFNRPFKPFLGALTFLVLQTPSPTSFRLAFLFNLILFSQSQKLLFDTDCSWKNVGNQLFEDLFSVPGYEMSTTIQYQLKPEL